MVWIFHFAIRLPLRTTPRARNIIDTYFFFVLAAAKFGDSCDEDAQCAAYLTGGICSGYTCDCSIGFHGYGVSCYRDAFVDEACTDRRECVLSQEMDNAVDCLEGICTCLTQRSIDGKGCLPIERTSSASRFMDVRIVLSAVAFASVCLLMDFVWNEQ